MDVKSTAWIWAPRVLGIFVVVFILGYSINQLGSGEPMWDQVKGFLNLFIPALLLVVGLVLGWKSPITGGVLINFTAIIYALVFLSRPMLILGITLPMLVVGSLFLISYGLNRPKQERKR